MKKILSGRKKTSIRTRLLFTFCLTASFMFVINLILYNGVNRSMKMLDEIYASNLRLSELSSCLEEIQDDAFTYLNTKSSDSLEDFYRKEQALLDMLDGLNSKNLDSSSMLLEKNIRNMAKSYLSCAEDTLQAKRGRNVEKYKELYLTATKSYHYIQTAIYNLNTLQFITNSDHYKVFSRSLEYAQVTSMTIILVMSVLNLILYPQNINNLISQNAYVFILATGMLLCILTGGNIDLSVGSVVCFVGSVGGVLMEKKHVPVFLALILMLIIGALIGAWQAFWIAYVHVPPFITTLSGMLIFRGLSNVVLGGQTLPIKTESFVRLFGGGANCFIPDFIGSGEGLNGVALAVGIIACLVYILVTVRGHLNRVKKGYETGNVAAMCAKTVLICAVVMFVTIKLAQYKGIPTSLVWVLIVVLIYAYITSKTTIGRHFYAVGGNEKATKLSGIDTRKVYFLAYTNMGLLAALAGMLTIARLTSAQPTYGQNYEMDAIGSCFIGGASAYGGIGTVPGVIIGAVLMGIINQGMSIMGTDQNMQKVVKGLVLLAAVIFDVVSKKKSE